MNSAELITEAFTLTPEKIAALPTAPKARREARPNFTPFEVIHAGAVREVSIAYRTIRDLDDPAPMVDGPDRVVELFPNVAGLEIEKCWAICLDVKNRVKAICELTSGTATASLLHPREVFRPALLAGAAGVIVVHNHPSGDPAPSKADLDMTRRLSESAKILGIVLSDHVILGRRDADATGRGRFSFAEAGLL